MAADGLVNIFADVQGNHGNIDGPVNAGERFPDRLAQAAKRQSTRPEHDVVPLLSPELPNQPSQSQNTDFAEPQQPNQLTSPAAAPEPPQAPPQALALQQHCAIIHSTTREATDAGHQLAADVVQGSLQPSADQAHAAADGCSLESQDHPFQQQDDTGLTGSSMDQKPNLQHQSLSCRIGSIPSAEAVPPGCAFSQLLSNSCKSSPLCKLSHMLPSHGHWTEVHLRVAPCMCIRSAELQALVMR